MKYEITKEQLQELAKWKHGKRLTQEWFPEAFETKLEVGKWYKRRSAIGDSYSLFFITSFNKEGSAFGYGFYESGIWFHQLDDNGYRCACNNTAIKTAVLATESEVFEALKKEAVKRGFVYGVQYLSPEHRMKNICNDNFSFHFESNIIYCNGIAIFNNGKWAEIIKEKTLSKSEAEAMINEFKKDGYDYKIR